MNSDFSMTLRLPVAAALSTLLLTAAGAHAQQEESDTTVVQIPPMTVEVLRAPTSGALSPFAVAGIDLAAAPIPTGGAFLADALRALPGLEVQNRHNYAVGERLSVRGFGARSQFGVRGLRAVLDGIPATLPDGQTTLDHVDPASLGRVELLRGPGSAWWGNGAGGVLLLESRAPAPGQQIDARAIMGALGRRELTARAANGGDGAGSPSSSVAVTHLRWDGFRTNPLAGGTYGEAERTILTARYGRDVGAGTLRVSAVGLDLDAENPGSLPADSLDDPDRSAWGNNVRQGTGKTVRQGQLGASWRGPLASHTAEVAAWGVARELRNPIPGTVVEVDRVVAGARVAVGGVVGGTLDWGAGVEAEVQSDDRLNFGNDDGRNGDLRLDQSERVRGTALFLRGGTSLGALEVQGAVRWDAVAFRVDDHFVAEGDPDDSGRRTLDALSPSIGVMLPVGSVGLFGSVASFLETPTTTELANRPEGSGGFNPDIEPTRGWTAEVGARGTAGARLGWEIVAFRTALDDELVPFEVPSDPGRTFFRNAGTSTHRGVELALNGRLGAGVAFRSALTHVDARFDEGPTEASDGEVIPGRVPTRFETRVTVQRSAFNAEVDLSWADEMPVDDAGESVAPSWFRTDLRVGLEPLRSGGAVIEPWAEIGNLFDASYVGSVTVNAFGGRYYEPAPGRTLSVGLRVGFRP
ncbi:TonB-dependent receptor [Gemmatimonadota bacterium DH-20]|uniref:TonB-dependent receptor n=2 Tax=Gaopeijia maritima TaxID=3119007 RepID=A0ABU9E9W9_9BACT